MKSEHLILRNLCGNIDYSRKVISFLKDEYFVDKSELIVFQIVKNYTICYNVLPTPDVLKLEIQKTVGYTDEIVQNSYKLVDVLFQIDANSNTAWLTDYTEKFCQDRALNSAIHESLLILEGKNKTLTKEALPELLREALSVSFDTSVGHDLLENSDDFYDYLTNPVSRLPWPVDMFNVVTNGGIPDKTLSLINGATNVGKTLTLCSCAAGHLAMGYDVLYFTMEMSEFEIAKRIHANALDVGLAKLPTLDQQTFKSKIIDLRKRTMGKLVVKEYPNGTPSTLTMRAFISELKLKKRFRPRVIYIDYLNIMASSRMARKGTATHEYAKSISEEVRAMSQLEGPPIISAGQLNRGGFGSSDPDLDDTADSFGTTMTADFIAILISNPELEKLGQYVVKQAKNRFGAKHINRSFVIGVDYDKQRIYDVDAPAYDNMMKDVTPAPEPETPQKLLMKKRPSVNFKDWKI